MLLHNASQLSGEDRFHCNNNSREIGTRHHGQNTVLRIAGKVNYIVVVKENFKFTSSIPTEWQHS